MQAGVVIIPTACISDSLMKEKDKVVNLVRILHLMTKVLIN